MTLRSRPGLVSVRSRPEMKSRPGLLWLSRKASRHGYDVATWVAVWEVATWIWCRDLEGPLWAETMSRHEIDVAT